MTQKEKELLLKDLCSRLPYGVKIGYIKNKKKYRLHELSEDGDYFSLLHETGPTGVCSELGIEYEGEQIIKPYLRPMSSMTEEENRIHDSLRRQIVNSSGNLLTESITAYNEFLISHHFDYRGLISMDLALEALEDMYK